MNRKIKVLIGIIICVIMSTSSVFAASIGYDESTISKTSTVKIVGKSDVAAYFQRNVTIVVLDKTATLEEYLSGFATPVYINNTNMAYDGSFAHAFPFDTYGKYKLYAVSEGYSEEISLDWYNWDEIKAFLDDLKNNNKSDLLNQLKKYSISLGMGSMNNITDMDEQNLIVKRVSEKTYTGDYDEIADSCRKVYIDAMNEYKQLLGIKNSTYWTEVQSFVDEIEKITETTFDYKSVPESYVAGQLMGKMYKSKEELESAINSIISRYTPPLSNVGGPGGGGGGGTPSRVSGNTSGVGIYVPDVSTEIYDDLQTVEWAKDAINSLSEKGVLAGVGGGKFAPDMNVTREQFVKMVVKAFGIPMAKGESRFDDVNSSEWYFEYIDAAYTAGIIKGTADNNFGIGENVTRQDMAVILYRCTKLLNQNYTGIRNNLMNDMNSVSDYAQEAVDTFVKAGIINGMDNGNFEPMQNATRAQSAVIIYRAMGGNGI